MAEHALLLGFPISDGQAARDLLELIEANSGAYYDLKRMMSEKERAKLEKAEVMRGFNEGNQRWFNEGRYDRTSSIYEKALKHDPSCPAILYQLANVCWALEYFDEVKQLVELLEDHQNRLGEFGRKIFDREKPRLLETSGFPTKMPQKVERLDYEYIVSMDFSKYSWMQINDAARERHLFKLAAYAVKKDFRLSEIERKKQHLGAAQK